MSTFEIIMPKLGESVEEATITKWFVKVGDTIVEDQLLLEIATDKVDSEIPSPVAGVVTEIKFAVDSLVPVGVVVAIIALEGDGQTHGTGEPGATVDKSLENEGKPIKAVLPNTAVLPPTRQGDRFYSPLVKSIALKENIPLQEFDSITGSGKNGRVTKEDVLAYLKQPGKVKQSPRPVTPQASPINTGQQPVNTPHVKAGDGDTVVEMDRLRKIIASHMVMSKQVSPHVTSIVEADVTNLVIWRDRVKKSFEEKHGEKITFMPIFTLATARALRDFPGINASVSGDTVILRKNVNIGIAVALPSGNLVVPVVKHADQKNLVGLATAINNLAQQARANKLSPDDIQGGTFTITNFGSFRNIMGTPIINQPQVAILATGSIEKKPSVLETPTGDVIAIRSKMYLSLSYDHRVVDGALGGFFLRKIADYLEEWNIDQEI